LHDEDEAKKTLPQQQVFLGEDEIGNWRTGYICRAQAPASTLKASSKGTEERPKAAPLKNP
jgi:hypothetical protein